MNITDNQKLAAIKTNKIFRNYSCIMCSYFIISLTFVFLFKEYSMLLFCIPCALVYGIELVLSFYAKPIISIWLNYGFTFLFITAFIILYGDGCGAQYFILVMVTMQFTTGWGGTGIRVLNSAILFAYYLLLYCYSVVYSPVYEISSIMTTIQQIISFLAAFIGLFSCLVIQTQIMRVTEENLVKREVELTKFENEDTLTGLFNRKTMMKYIEQYIDEQKEDANKKICIAIGDIDQFAKINDRYGHDCGDNLLKQLAGQLKEEMSEYGRVARWGGEQFIFFFENATGEDAYYYLTQVQKSMRSERYECKDEKIGITMTYGLMEYNPTKSIDFCIVEADKKMFMGKESGRNTIIF